MELKKVITSNSLLILNERSELPKEVGKVVMIRSNNNQEIANLLPELSKPFDSIIFDANKNYEFILDIIKLIGEKAIDEKTIVVILKTLPENNIQISPLYSGDVYRAVIELVNYHGFIQETTEEGQGISFLHKGKSGEIAIPRYISEIKNSLLKTSHKNEVIESEDKTTETDKIDSYKKRGRKSKS